MFADVLRAALERDPTADALIWRDEFYSCAWLRERTRLFEDRLQEWEIGAGTVVALEADFSPNSVALFLALLDRACILVPLTRSVEGKKPQFRAVARCQRAVSIDDDDEVTLQKLDGAGDHALQEELRRRGHPGLILFSSGSTGESKAALHDLVPLLEKFAVPRPALRTLSFLLYDHIGGVNTMLYALASGGCLVTVPRRDPETVLAAVARHRVELLPTSPTFLNLVLLSQAYRHHDLSSLELVTYGTEPMLQSTLARLHELLPGVQFQQTYGLSEVGILRSRSRSSDSLWVQVGGEGFETRVVDGILHVKARSAMLGYLNAPSPFTADGWLVTGDQVEVDGAYLRILGRRSEIINVGGEKVYPAEVESVIQELPEVAEVAVHGEKNAILGNIVCARVTPASADVEEQELARRIKRHCRERLESFKVPVKVALTPAPQHGGRFKKLRPR